MDADYGSNYAELYRCHWWWRAREQILRRVLARLPLPVAPEILDFGCGDGLSFSMLGEFGAVRGIETATALVDPSNPLRSRISTAALGAAEYADWQFDLITAFDVIEHIDDDALALRQLCAMLRPGGSMVVTLPAFMSLWDQHDVLNRHFRRYTRADFERIIPPGVRLVEARYMFHSLFPMKWLLARLNRIRERAVAQHGIPRAPINFLLEKACVAEFSLLGWARIPVGTSLLAVIKAEG